MPPTVIHINQKGRVLQDGTAVLFRKAAGVLVHLGLKPILPVLLVKLVVVTDATKQRPFKKARWSYNVVDRTRRARKYNPIKFASDTTIIQHTLPPIATARWRKKLNLPNTRVE
jgi:hypothetical protein